MNPYRVIDPAVWPRQRTFEFYRTFASSAFNVTVQLEAGALYDCAKARGESFFLLTLYAILRAANAVPEMRQRVVNGEVREFERIAVMTPVMTAGEMFRQIWCEYEPSYPEFRAQAEPRVEAARHGAPAPLTDHGDDFLCASCVPWLHFTSVVQAEYTFDQTVPILAWGKLNRDRQLPVGCKFNHCLMDGLHVSRFFNGLELLLAEPERLYRTVPAPAWQNEKES